MKPMHRTVLALLDFSKAFDQVWRDHLLLQLVKIGTPLQYVRWLREFFSNRMVRVLINGSTGDAVRFSDGVPQGSVLSPLLFLIAINSAASCRGECHMSLYADDIAIWSSAKSITEASDRVATGVERLSQWSRQSKLCLNFDKCECTFFSTDTHEASFVPAVQVQGRQLKFNPTPRFLGVTYDRTLSFRSHIDNVCNTIHSRCRMLSVLTIKE